MCVCVCVGVCVTHCTSSYLAVCAISVVVVVQCAVVDHCRYVRMFVLHEMYSECVCVCVFVCV